MDNWNIQCLGCYCFVWGCPHRQRRVGGEVCGYSLLICEVLVGYDELSLALFQQHKDNHTYPIQYDIHCLNMHSKEIRIHLHLRKTYILQKEYLPLQWLYLDFHESHQWTFFKLFTETWKGILQRVCLLVQFHKNWTKSHISQWVSMLCIF